MNQHPDRLISPRTIQNFKRASSRQVLLPGNTVLYINLWCDGFYFFPTRQREFSIPWWELETTVHKQVNVTRYYWMKFGLAVVRPTY